MPPKAAHLFIIAAPSGGGKSTLCREVLKRFSDMRYSVSYTTRKRRRGEQDGVDYHFINKHDFKVPFVCGCRNLGEALRRIGEGAAMIRTKGEAGTGNIVEAVRHMRTVMDGIRLVVNAPQEELMTIAKDMGAPLPRAVSPLRLTPRS